VYAVYAKSKKIFLSMKWMFVTRKNLAEKLNMVLRKCVVTAGIGRGITLKDILINDMS